MAECADAWVESQTQGDQDVYFSLCPGVGESGFWYLARPAPVVYEGPGGYWARSKASGAKARWTDMDPVRIDMIGDVAVYYFTATWEIESPDGATREFVSNRIRVFKREGGRWLRAGGAAVNVG